MRRPYIFNTIIAITVLVFGASMAFAQVAPLRGSVKVMGADGQAAPAPGAVVDVYRSDISGEYHTKADKKGQWVFVGLPLVGTYVVAVSAPGAAPGARGGVRTGQEIPVDITLNAGDGHKLTRQEAFALSKGGGGNSSSGNSSGESAADKAKREELAKKNAEIEAANKKIENSNQVITDAFKNGNAALIAKNYDEAVKQYDLGIAADPEHPGIPSLLANKSAALRSRAVEKYNAAIQSKDEAAKAAGVSAAKEDFKASAEAASRAVELIKKLPAATDPAAQKLEETNKYFALSARAESMRLYVTKVDPTKADEAATAFEEYMAAESDPAKKSKAEFDLAQMLFDANEYDKAKAVYERILAATPDNPDALANMGLIYFNAGATKEAEGKKDEAKPLYQQAANYLQKFIDKAPDTHRFKADAKAVLDEMKNQQNVQAEKTTTTTPQRRKRP